MTAFLYKRNTRMLKVFQYIVILGSLPGTDSHFFICHVLNKQHGIVKLSFCCCRQLQRVIIGANVYYELL